MTATTSAATKNFFGKRFLTDIFENKKVLIINFVLELLGLPVVSVLVLIAAYYDKLSETKDIYYDITLLLLPFIFIGVGTIIISILLGFVIALFQFNYLYRKSLVDMNYSLPLSNTQRFFADYLSGLAIYIIPVFIAVVISFIILGVGNVFVDIEDFWSIMPHIIKAGMIVIVGMIMLYTISVFSIIFCGSTFEAIFSIIAVNAMIPATIGCVWLAIVTTTSYGMVGNSIFYSPVFSATSPIGATVFFFMYLFETVEMTSPGLIQSHYESMYIRWMAVAIAVTLIYLAVSYLLYRIRKAESVSKPYVFKAFFYAIGAMTVFCIFSLLLATSINIVSAVISGIIICGIGWFIMEVIARRGFKRFWTAPLGFTAVICGVFLLCGICKVTDGFGAPRHVPAALSVESVTIDVNDTSILPSNVYKINFRDKDVIKAVTAFHKDAVDRHFHFDKYTYTDIENIDRDYDRFDHQRVEITYQTIYGSTIKREYDVMSSMLTEVTAAILCSDEYAQNASEQIAVNAVNATSYVSSFSDIKKDKKGGRLTVSNKLLQTGDTVSLGYESLIALTEAYRKDISAMTPEQLASSNVYCYFGEYWVLDSFDNTIDFLESRDITVSPIRESDISNGGYQVNGYDYATATGIELKTSPRFYSYPEGYFGKHDDSDRYSYYGAYYGYDEDSNYSEVDSITAAFPDSYNYYGYSSDLSSDEPVNDELLQLINGSTPIILGEKPIAIIHYNSNTYYVRDTAENRALIKQHYYG